MKAFRRALLALGLAGVIAAILRLRGSGGTPPQHGGWRELSGAGCSPGLTCVLAAHAAASLDRVDEVHVAKVGTGGPSCAEAHHRALAGEALDWRDGAWVSRRAGSGRELCWFPDPIGGADCYRAALPDALLLAPAFPGAERITARLDAALQHLERLAAQL